MATNNRGGTRTRKAPSSNSERRNQYSRSPIATAATVGGAVAAGIFLWSRRNQIGEQLGNLAEQIGDWREGMASGSKPDTSDSSSGVRFMPNSGSEPASGQRSQAEIAEEALTLKEIGTAS
jgi:hypothetical protein